MLGEWNVFVQAGFDWILKLSLCKFRTFETYFFFPFEKLKYIAISPFFAISCFKHALLHVH